MKKETIRIGGMSCMSCQSRIEKKLRAAGGIEAAAVDYRSGTAELSYDPALITFDQIKGLIEGMGYRVREPGEGGAPWRETAGTLVLILALFVLLRGLGLGSLASAFPLAEAGMGWGLLFLIGLATSVHCAAMCGGITLSQCLPPGGEGGSGGGRGKVLLPALLSPGGRVVSYTVVGVVVGALGQVVTLSGRFQGLVQLAAGAFMVVMGLNMLGLFPALRRVSPRLPRFLRSFAGKRGGRRAGGRNPLFIGLLNGLMPCGPLQAMQLYALSTGSPVAGGLSMLLFSLGTVPLMFGLGAVSSLLGSRAKGAFTRGVMRFGAVLVTVMGLSMGSYGFALGGWSIPVPFGLDAAGGAGGSASGVNGNAAVVAASAELREEAGGAVQVVASSLSPSRYPAITVRQGIPVRWTITAPAGSINGCNNRIIIREYGIEHRFSPGENIIEFTPERTGRFSYSCWMGMIRSSITVVAEGESVPAGGVAAEAVEEELAPSPAGVVIPTGAVALAEKREGYQTVKIVLRDEGIEPALIVVERGLPTAWVIHRASLDPGNDRLLVPAYVTTLEMKQGDNVVELLPEEDFDFSTGDHVFYGYVKVVDNLGEVDMEVVKAEVGEFEPLIYPDEYFEGDGCCGRS